MKARVVLGVGTSIFGWMLIQWDSPDLFSLTTFRFLLGGMALIIGNDLTWSDKWPWDK